MAAPAVASPPFSCAFCYVGLSAAEVKKCGKCGVRAYCSPKCQKADWAAAGGQHHKVWCSEKCGEEDVDWDIRSCGMGLGMFAKRPFRAWERISVERCTLFNSQDTLNRYQVRLVVI